MLCPLPCPRDPHSFTFISLIEHKHIKNLHPIWLHIEYVLWNNNLSWTKVKYDVTYSKSIFNTRLFLSYESSDSCISQLLLGTKLVTPWTSHCIETTATSTTDISKVQNGFHVHVFLDSGRSTSANLQQTQKDRATLKLKGPIILCAPQLAFYVVVQALYTLGHCLSLITLITGSAILCLFR